MGFVGGAAHGSDYKQQVWSPVELYNVRQLSIPTVQRYFFIISR